MAKYDRILLFGRMESCVPYVEQIRPQRKMGPMLLDNAERQQAGSCGPHNGLHEIWRGELLPMDRQFLLSE